MSQIVRLAAALSHRTSALADLVYPPQCLVCGASSTGTENIAFCSECLSQLARDAAPRCSRCAAVSSGMFAADGIDRGCPWCEKHRLAFDRTFTLGGYQGVLRDVVLRSKHVWGDCLMLAAAELLWQRHAEVLRSEPIDAVIAVPMHWTRRLWRSVNHPELLAAHLARRLRSPNWSQRVARIRRTMPQGPLAPTSRMKNMRGAFQVDRRTNWRGKRLLLVDDVLTTGATCGEIARVLKRGGAQRVVVAVVARAGAPS